MADAGGEHSRSAVAGVFCFEVEYLVESTMVKQESEAEPPIAARA